LPGREGQRGDGGREGEREGERRSKRKEGGRGTLGNQVVIVR